jgi:hypothetical protein
MLLSRKVILIVSHKKKQCGIYQYGLNIFEALKKSARYLFQYRECSSNSDLHQAILHVRPDVIIYNYYPATMPWLETKITRSYNIPQLGMMHEVTQEEADKATSEFFDYHLCADPTLREKNSSIIRTIRLIPTYINVKPMPRVTTIGSFGFGFADKGFERLIETVQNEFERARIALHMPFNDVVDKHGKFHARATALRCRQLISKPGIELRINHKFLSKQRLLDFLAGNTLNAFFYDTSKMRGISSTIEYALAVHRPIAITKCGMFRHVYNARPSICIEDSTMTQIIDNGINPLVPFYDEWREEKFIADYERILALVLDRSRIHMVTSVCHDIDDRHKAGRI